jgi:hypothetical protein
MKPQELPRFNQKTAVSYNFNVFSSSALMTLLTLSYYAVVCDPLIMIAKILISSSQDNSSSLEGHMDSTFRVDFQ